MTQTVPDISPLMPMHQDPLLVNPFRANFNYFYESFRFNQHEKSYPISENPMISARIAFYLLVLTHWDQDKMAITLADEKLKCIFN